jgi:putative PEP-CTERM system TPR-repeat lipoprotein
MQGKGLFIRVLPVLAVALALTACNQSAKETVKQARQNESQGQYRTALIQMKGLLKDHPDNGAAWLVLGRASLHMGSPEDAVTELGKAKKHGVPPGIVAVPLARALLVEGKSEKLLTTIKPADVRNTSNKVKLYIYRGNAYLASDKPGQAEKSYHAALRLDPDAADASVGLAKVDIARHKTSRAASRLEEIKQAHPDNPRAWLLTARMQMANKQYAKAKKSLKHALADKNGDLLPQERFMARASMAESDIRRNELKSARKTLEHLNKQAPNEPYANYLRALVAYKLKKYKVAESHLQNVLHVAPQSESAQLLLGAVGYAEGRYGQAQMHLSSVIGRDPHNKKARKILALTLYKAGQTDQAIQVMRPAIGKHYSKARLLAMLSAAANDPMSSGHYGGPEPKNETERLKFARQALMAGKPRSAVSLLQNAPRPEKGGKADYKHARLFIIALLRQGDTDKAIAKSRALIKAHPDDAEPRVLLGGSLVVAGKADKAKAQFNKALEADPHNLLARMSLARLAFSAHHYKTAADDYHAVLKSHPKYARSIVGLARTEDARGHQDKALALVEKARKVDPKAVAPRLLLVRYYSARHKPKKALDIAEEAADIAPDSGLVMNTLGITQLAAGDKDAAIDSFTKAVKAKPHSASFRTNLARAEIAQKQFADAGDNLQEVVNHHPRYVPAVSLYALTQLQSGRMFEALALARGLRDTNPTVAYTLEGDLDVLDKQYDDAVSAYQQALKHKKSQALMMKLLAAANAAGKGGVDQTALAWLQKHPKDGALRSALGDYYMSLDQNDKAMTQYQKVFSHYPHNVAVLNNIAWLYSLRQDPKALNFARKAHKLAPKRAQITDTLGWALLQSGHGTEAVDTLSTAAKQAPKSASIRYHLASALARTGQKSKARKILKKLLASNDKFAERDAAEKLYAGLQ